MRLQLNITLLCLVILHTLSANSAVTKTLRSGSTSDGSTKRSDSSGETETELEEQHGEGLAQQVIDTLSSVASGVYRRGALVMRVLGKATVVFSNEPKKLQAIVSELTEGLITKAPEAVSIDPIENQTPGVKYFCAANGKIHNLRSIKHIETTKKIGSDSITLYITYTFQELYFFFESFQLNLLNLNMSGKLRLNYGDNKVLLVVRIPKIKNIPLKIVRGKCLVYIEDFKVDTFEFKDSKTSDVKAIGNYYVSFIENKIAEDMQSKGDFYKNKFEMKVLTKFHKMLPTTGSWVCKDEKLAKEVRRRGPVLDDYVPSAELKKTCLKDNPQ